MVVVVVRVVVVRGVGWAAVVVVQVVRYLKAGSWMQLKLVRHVTCDKHMYMPTHDAHTRTATLT